MAVQLPVLRYGLAASSSAIALARRFVLISSKEEKDVVANYKLGVNAYIVNPVDFHEFVNAIKESRVFWRSMSTRQEA
jgi:DNA-binding NarL/FixJ family response regulator